MRLLIATCFIPYPFDSGGNIAQFALLEALQHKIDVTLFFPVFRDDQFITAQELQKLLPNVRLKIADMRPLRPGKPSWGRRLANFGKALTNQKPLVLKQSDELDSPLFIHPVHINYLLFKKIHEVIDQDVYDVIQVEFFEFLEVGKILPAQIPRLFVHHEIRFQRLQRFAASTGKEPAFIDFAIRRAKAIELEQLSVFDGIITFSEVDQKILQPYLNVPVLNIPFPVLEKEMTGAVSPTPIDKLSFIGGEGHSPNLDGLRWFVSEIFEPIWNKYRLPLYVIGTWGKAVQAELSKPGKIIFAGYVEDYTALVASSVMVIPIRIGSGIRTKILYGMAKKVPIVSTTIGAEGLGAQDLENIMLADNAEQFLIAVGKLLHDENLKNKITDNAFNHVKQNFSQKEIADRRIDFYNSLIVEKNKQRNSQS